MMKSVFSIFALVSLVSSAFGVSYITPDSEEWPSEETWQNDLGISLSTDATLHGPIPPSLFSSSCEVLGTNAFAISASGNGTCMHNFACQYQFCRPDLLGTPSNYSSLPIYVVEAMSSADVTAALEFANTHNIQVSIKLTGHSYQASSTAGNSLLIWMQNFPKDDTITSNFTDSCGTVFDTVIGVSGGEVFDDIIAAAGPNYHYVAGSCRTVGAIGGWLQGVGLSFSSRQYGVGVDNVVTFDVVLANGTEVRADACTNPDLFWALRGGGGGTWGVVTHAHYRLHPVTPVVRVAWFVAGTPRRPEDLENFVRDWLKYWIMVSPNLDSRWSGFFSSSGVFLIFSGSLEDAQTTFINDFENWYNTELNTTAFEAGVFGAFPPSLTVQVFDSWFDFRGGEENINNPDETDPTGDAYRGIELQSARLFPRDFVLENPDEILELLIQVWSVAPSFVNYYLGGKMMDVAPNATAVHPAMRKALWAVHTFDLVANQMVRDFLPNNITGASFNHHDTSEPDWREALWGENYPRLLEIKNKYDPDRRFNCWHCVGYEGPELDGEIVTSTDAVISVPEVPIATPEPAAATPEPVDNTTVAPGPMVDNTPAPMDNMTTAPAPMDNATTAPAPSPTSGASSVFENFTLTRMVFGLLVLVVLQV